MCWFLVDIVRRSHIFKYDLEDEKRRAGKGRVLETVKDPISKARS